MEQIEEYYKKGCKCELHESSNAGCVKKNSFDEIEDTILSLREYSNQMLDAVILRRKKHVSTEKLITCITEKEFAEVVSATFSLKCFFYFTSKDLFVTEKFTVQNFIYSNFMT